MSSASLQVVGRLLQADPGPSNSSVLQYEAEGSLTVHGALRSVEVLTAWQPKACDERGWYDSCVVVAQISRSDRLTSSSRLLGGIEESRAGLELALGQILAAQRFSSLL